jgi:hypothetical protein
MTTVKDEVAGLFERLGRGELSRPETGPSSGWETPLPSGRVVTRSALEAEARALVALGPEAVTYLLPQVLNDNPALRYVATYALGEITGERPELLHFDRAGHEEDRARAIETWRRWYAARQG